MGMTWELQSLTILNGDEIRDDIGDNEDDRWPEVIPGSGDDEDNIDNSSA